jgi:phosphopantothenoylcysteine decarboxylase/phosphopantothenate--cysteine ligase
MPEPETIFAHVGRWLEQPRDLDGAHVLVTAGPTREALDPVRFITNHSSGKMGTALAAAAWRRGASVTLIAGPLQVAVPPGIAHVPVESTQEMADRVGEHLGAADVLVMAAAPADFRPASVADRKLKRGEGTRSIELAPTADILATTRERRRPGAVTVGFALETNDTLANARGKLRAKSVDLIVLNDATEAGAGFGVDTNRVTFVAADGEEELPLLPKSDVADAILDRVVRLRAARAGASS